MTISTDELVRLASTVARVRLLHAETRIERGRRNTFVRELIERGERYRSVAQASGLSLAAVAGIAAGASTPGQRDVSQKLTYAK